ncbi:hypothetical protein Tco_1521883, partial [Tanacetum coccineum]
IEEYNNEPESTYPYEEVDPLNPSPPASKLEPEDVIEVEDTIKREDKTVLASVHEAEGMAAMENLVRKLGNTKEKAKCKKLKKELEEARPNEAIDVPVEDEKSLSSEPRGSPPAVRKMIKESVNAAIDAKRARYVNARNDARGSGPVRGQYVAPVVRGCTFAGLMKCNPTILRGIEGAVELRRWFKKTESVFRISECAEGKKRFNGLALMCSRMVKSESMKVDAYIRGLLENIKGEVTSSRPTNLNEAVRMAHKLMEQKSQARDERILEGKKQKWE